jgi:hypothetical protein
MLNMAPLGAPSPMSLDSRFKAEWNSTFIGVKFDHSGDRWDAYGSVEYHDVDYEATANWNLRDDLSHPRSFKQDSSGSGPVYVIGTRYRYGNNWAFNATLSRTQWDADNGTDKTTLASGAVVTNELDKVRWESNAIMLGVSYLSGQY